jgi:hypothetical protein
MRMSSVSRLEKGHLTGCWYSHCEAFGAYRTGRYTAEAKVERQAAPALLRELRRLIDVGD